SGMASALNKPLFRVNAGWMELFALHACPERSRRADGDDLRARIILHLSDFTTDGSPDPDHLDQALLESCVERPEDVSHFLWKADTFGAKVPGAPSIRRFLADPRGLRAVRRFNLNHMNRCRARPVRGARLHPHPQKPRPQCLPGEPLPQPRRRDARRSGPGISDRIVLERLRQRERPEQDALPGLRA